MKILFVISQLPYPPDTGAKIRSFNLLKELSGRHAITAVAYASGSPEDSAKIEALAGLGVRVVTVPVRHKPVWAAALANIFSPLPYSVMKYTTSTLAKTVSGLIAANEFEVVHCDSLQMSGNLKPTGALPAVLTEHNVEAVIWERYAQKENNLLKKFYLRMQYHKMRHYEYSACSRFSRVVTVSDDDKRQIEANCDQCNISVAPNGVDCEYFRPGSGPIDSPTMVFTGSLDWLPNDDALIYFFEKIYPAVKKAVPGTGIKIIGRNPGKRLLEYSRKDSSIIITGRVDDVRPHVLGGRVFVVPLRIGGGTRLKILEAMSMGMPVISTTIGAEGIEVRAGEDIIIADQPADFARQVIELFRDSGKCATLGENARRTVEMRYDWKIVAKELERAWSDCAEKK